MVLAVSLDVQAAEVFVAVAEELHFGRAAARVHMTQPAVSRHVSRLETSLGVTLLARTNRHVELTPEGSVFLTAARDVLAAARRAVEAAQLAARGGVGRIRLGSAGTLPNELAGRLVRAFRRDHSTVEVQLSQSSYISSPIADVDRDRVDLAVVRAPVGATGVEFHPLVREPRLLVVSAEHPLVGARSVELHEVAGESIVSSAHWPRRIRDYWAGVDDGADPAYDVSVLANGPGEWLNSLAEGRGVSLCPASIAGYYKRRDLAYLPVAGIAPNEIGLAWRRDHDGPLLQNFIVGASMYIATHPLRDPVSD
jgi:DNA-binding transcriptional LysR family regulator